MRDIPSAQPPKTDCSYVYDWLRTEILSGRIKPNERLIESHYAKKLGVSRTPVREALRLLERDGLVDFKPKRGATARQLLRESEVEEIFRLRTLLQLDSAPETVRNLTEEELEQMAACNAACRQAVEADDTDAFFRHYDRFNLLLLEGCKMQMVIKILMMLEHLDPITSMMGGTESAPTVQFRRIAISTWEGRRRSLSEHEAIYEALKRRDLTAYTEALRTHTESCDMACREGLRRLRAGVEDRADRESRGSRENRTDRIENRGAAPK